MEGSNPEKVIAVLRSDPSRWLCDDCTAHLAGVKNRAAVNAIAKTLGLTSDFDRERSECSRCGETKFVTRPRRD